MKTIEEHKANIQEFANRFKLIFEDDGEVGFGRKCVGLINGSNYVDYNPTQYPNYDYVEEFYDERLFDIVPENAYHKHNCLAVLGNEETSIIQLSEWIDKLKELGAVVEKYKTGATGIQALITGTENYAIKLTK
jgi:glycyl-tRNA synthetase beta subunit